MFDNVKTFVTVTTYLAGKKEKKLIYYLSVVSLCLYPLAGLSICPLLYPSVQNISQGMQKRKGASL